MRPAGRGWSPRSSRPDPALAVIAGLAKEAADKAAKAGSYFSFWMFMALLFGAAAATLGGIVGGELRDADMIGRRRAAAIG